MSCRPDAVKHVRAAAFSFLIGYFGSCRFLPSVTVPTRTQPLRHPCGSSRGLRKPCPQVRQSSSDPDPTSACWTEHPEQVSCHRRPCVPVEIKNPVVILDLVLIAGRSLANQAVRLAALQVRWNRRRCMRQSPCTAPSAACRTSRYTQEATGDLLPSTWRWSSGKCSSADDQQTGC
jgi:hypothetical protein